MKLVHGVFFNLTKYIKICIHVASSEIIYIIKMGNFTHEILTTSKYAHTLFFFIFKYKNNIDLYFFLNNVCVSKYLYSI